MTIPYNTVHQANALNHAVKLTNHRYKAQLKISQQERMHEQLHRLQTTSLPGGTQSHTHNNTSWFHVLEEEHPCVPAVDWRAGLTG